MSAPAGRVPWRPPWPGGARRLSALLLVGAPLLSAGCRQVPQQKPTTDILRQGRDIFRDDTFGSEKFWTDTARLHEVIENGIQPLEALALGLKVDEVDMDRLNLAKFVIHNPFGVGGTKELLRQHAVVGLRAQFDGDRITRIGMTCALCRVGVTLTDNNAGTLHAPSGTGMDSAYAARTSQKKYRATPLRGLWQHAPYFHDKRAATLEAVVEHYDARRNLGLTTAQRADLV